MCCFIWLIHFIFSWTSKSTLPEEWSLLLNRTQSKSPQNYWAGLWNLGRVTGKGYWLTSIKGSSKCQWKRTPADVQSRYQEVQNKCFSFIFSWWNWYRYRWLWFHECWNKKDRAEKYFFFSAAEEISEEKLQRLMDWNVELCEDLLRPIIVQKKHRKLVGRAFNFQHVLLCGEPRIHVPGRWFHC